MRVVAFTGLPGAGKTDAVDEARRRGLPIVVMGDFVRAEAGSRGLAGVDADLGAVAQELRRREGADVFARRTVEEIRQKHAKARVVVVDGVRSLEEIATFRARLGGAFKLVAIEAPDAARYARLRSRGRRDDSTSEAAIVARDAREKAWGLVDAIRTADARIRNEGTLDEFHRQVTRLFDELMASAEGASSTAARRPASGRPL